MRIANRKGAKDAKENYFFESEKTIRIGAFLLPICASERENLAFLAP